MEELAPVLWFIFGVLALLFLGWAISTFNLTFADLAGMTFLLVVFGCFYRWYDHLLDDANWRGPWDPPEEKK